MSSCRNMEQPQQLANSRSGGTNSTAKRVVCRKAPVIKQTLTSLYRIAKANPLLVLQGDANQQANDFGLNNMKLPKSVLLPNTCRTFNSETFTNKSIVNINEQRSAPFSRSASLKIKSDASYNKTQLKRTTSVRKPSTSKHEPKHETRCISEHGKVLKSAIPAVTLNKPANTSSVSNLVTAVKKSIKPEKRRSLSAEHYDRKKGLLKIKTVQLMNTRKGIQPLNDMGKMAAALPPAVSPIIEEFRTVSFKTPSMHKKRSISMTSITPTPLHKHFTSTPRSTINDLGQRLREWLQSHQKPVDTYKHLKCFGLHNSSNDQAQLNDENKENREALTKSTSYENLKIAPDDSLISVVSDLTLTNGNGNSYIDNRPIVQDALADLHKLILDGYPHQQCEAWLGMMRQKCNSLDEEPQYWECRAAIEQTRGNITSAVECLRTAIVQGAELKGVDHSLEQLLQKFSLLNISDHSDQDKNNMQKTDRARIVLDARNVFKSPIIQFAVQERALKTGWLTGNKASLEKQMTLALQPAEPMGCRFGVCDLRRNAVSIILSQDRRMAAVTDVLGRIMLMDSHRGVVLRMFKGYREAQCAFVQVPDEKRSKHRANTRVATFLLIYSPKKGTLEIFSAQQGLKIATFTASKFSILLYINYGLVGFTVTSKSRYICSFTCVMIDSDGQVKEVVIPFHFALTEKNSKRARDLHLYKRLKQFIRTGDDSFMTEAINTCMEIKTSEVHLQCLQMLMSCKEIQPDIILKCTEYFYEKYQLLDDEEIIGDTKTLKILSENVNVLTYFYLFLMSTSNEQLDIENGNDSDGNKNERDTKLCLGDKVINNLQKLLDLSTLSDNTKSPEIKVSFFEDSGFNFCEFLSGFDLSKPEKINLKPNLDSTSLFKISEHIFKQYLSENRNNFEELKKRSPKATF